MMPGSILGVQGFKTRLDANQVGPSLNFIGTGYTQAPGLSVDWEQCHIATYFHVGLDYLEKMGEMDNTRAPEYEDAARKAQEVLGYLTRLQQRRMAGG